MGSGTAAEGDSHRQSRGTGYQRFRRSRPVQWAWLDLNQRPHPYQGSAQGLFPQDCSGGLRERRAAGDRWGRWEPLDSDGMWPKRGSGVSRSRGQWRSASRTLLGKVDPRRLPRQASPAGSALLGSPGEVWARDIPLYRRAIPGQRHGGTPAFCPFKPRGPSRSPRSSLARARRGLRQLQNSILRLSRLAWQVATNLKEDRVVILARMRHL